MKNHFAQAPGLICWVMVHFNHFHINSILILALAALFYAPSTLQPAQAADVQVAPPILDYTYPFNDPRLSQQLAAKRQVAELFTSLDCLFCPRAERLVSDLAQKTAVLTLVYHTDPEGMIIPWPANFPCAVNNPIASGWRMGFYTRLNWSLTGILMRPVMILMT